jgi:predicted kinase
VATQPKLIAVSGPPCSGKTTLAGELRQKTGIVHLELDILRSQLLPDSRQDEHDRDITYRAMHLIAQYLLCAGHSVILDATYVRAVQRQALQHLARTTNAGLRIIQCRISPELAVRRFSTRPPGHFAVDLTEERVRELASDYRYDSGDVLVIPAEDSVESNLKRIESYI